MIWLLSHSAYYLLFPIVLLLLLLKCGVLNKGKRLKLPPGPRPLPLIGNLLEVGHLPHVSFHRLSKQYGPIMYLKLGQVPAIVVSSTDVAAEIFQTQDKNFSNRATSIAIDRLTYDHRDLGFSPYGERWKRLRRVCNITMFSLSRVMSFRSIREEETQILVNTIRKDSMHNGKAIVNLTEMLLCLFNNIIFQEVFGKRISMAGECRSTPYHGMLKEALTMMAGFTTGDFIPSLRWVNYLNRWNSKLDKVFRKMDQLLEEEIQERVKGRRCDEHDNDLLSELLRRQVEMDPLLGYLLSKEEIKGILMEMFTGGTDSSEVTAEWAIAELIKNPKILKRAQQEVRQVVGDKGKVEESDMQHIHFLKLAIKESLRLHPAAAILPPREALKDTKISGYDIPAKTRLIVNNWAMGRDPRYWDDAERFHPERPDNDSFNLQGNNYQFLPFGTGRRICPGIELGMAGVELSVATLLYSFNWELPNGIRGEDINMDELFGLSNRRKMPLILVAEPSF